MARVTAFSQQVDVFLGQLQGTGRQSALAAAAKAARDEAKAQNERILQRPVRFETIVDGRPGASEDQVKPNGTIVYLFAVGSATLAAAVDEAFSLLAQLAPVRSGRFQKSFRLFVNGTQRDFSDQQRVIDLEETDEVQLTNLQPYARKIERGWSDEAPNGVFEVAATVLRQRFSNVVAVRFAYDRYPGFEVGTNRAGGRLRTRGDFDRAARYPTIYMTLK